MCLTEYDEQRHLDNVRREGREEGREEGVLALIRTLKKLNQSMDFIVRCIMDEFGLSEFEAKKYL